MNVTAQWKPFNKVDAMVYVAALLLGVAIPFVNMLEASHQKRQDHYMDKILSRMDQAGVLLSEWRAMDVR